MNDQEITDRDETRRLAYVMMAALHPGVREYRGMAELIGTIAHGVMHHAGQGTAAGGVYIVNLLAEGISSMSNAPRIEARDYLASRINELSGQIDTLKRPGGYGDGEREETFMSTPRREFLAAVHAALEAVAADPDGRWHGHDASGDTMYEVEVALDAYLRTRHALPGTQTEEDLRMALDMLDRVLGSFVEKGHPGFEGLRTGWLKINQVQQWRAWAAAARSRLRS